MKFKIDENLPVELAQLLNQYKHDALTVLDQNLHGSDDPKIIKICLQEGRILVTLDKDFADIRNYPPYSYPGIVVFRVSRQSKTHLLKVLKRLIPLFDREPIRKHLWIVEDSRVRVWGRGI
jgi:predicted nuclease of predicted toxin-antitoxin system